jgi:hypothetical protein
MAASFDVGDLTDLVELGPIEGDTGEFSDIDEDILGALLENTESNCVFEYSLASTSTEQAVMEIAKALEEEHKPPGISLKREPRFKTLTEDELKDIESKRQAKPTKSKTKWGVKILQGNSSFIV